MRTVRNGRSIDASAISSRHVARHEVEVPCPSSSAVPSPPQSCSLRHCLRLSAGAGRNRSIVQDMVAIPGRGGFIAILRARPDQHVDRVTTGSRVALPVGRFEKLSFQPDRGGRHHVRAGEEQLDRGARRGDRTGEVVPSKRGCSRGSRHQLLGEQRSIRSAAAVSECGLADRHRRAHRRRDCLVRRSGTRGRSRRPQSRPHEDPSSADQQPRSHLPDLFIVSLPAGGAGYVASPGDIHAYDVRSGKLAWVFHTVPERGEPGAETWPDEALATGSGVHNWSELTVDEARGIVFIPTGYGALRLLRRQSSGRESLCQQRARARREDGRASGTSRPCTTICGTTTWRRRRSC